MRRIQLVYARLINAFQRGDVDRILYYSADLGHYVADPRTAAYHRELQWADDNQVGIRAFWESRIPELSA